MEQSTAVAAPVAAIPAAPVVVSTTPPGGPRPHRPWSRACLPPWHLEPRDHGIVELRDRRHRALAHFLPGTERAARLARIAPLLAQAVQAYAEWTKVQRAGDEHLDVHRLRVADAEERCRRLMERALVWLNTTEDPRGPASGEGQSLEDLEALLGELAPEAAPETGGAP